MSQESDISWQVLRRIAQDWAGTSAELSLVRPLDGGCISTTVALELADGTRAVCKLSPHRVDRSFINEAHQLKILAGLGLPVPTVYAAKLGSLDDPFSYILMEFVDGVNLNEAHKVCSVEQFDFLQEHLAELLLTLHSQHAPHYGRVEIEPPAAEYSNWTAFYRHVFDPICEEALQSPLIVNKVRKHILRIHERLESLLRHDDVPRLLHWDVWATNILCAPDVSGRWQVAAILDPNCKYAHVEAELAYMALFHTSTPAFLRAYQKHRRLGDDYHRVRKLVYQLYFLLNHICLFGNEYVNPVSSLLDRLAPIV